MYLKFQICIMNTFPAYLWRLFADYDPKIIIETFHRYIHDVSRD